MRELSLKEQLCTESTYPANKARKTAELGSSDGAWPIKACTSPRQLTMTQTVKSG